AGTVSAAARLDVAIVREEEDGCLLLRGKATRLDQRRCPGDLLPGLAVTAFDLLHTCLDPRLIGLASADADERRSTGQHRQHRHPVRHRNLLVGRPPRRMPALYPKPPTRTRRGYCAAPGPWGLALYLRRRNGTACLCFERCPS